MSATSGAMLGLGAYVDMCWDLLGWRLACCWWTLGSCGARRCSRWSGDERAAGDSGRQIEAISHEMCLPVESKCYNEMVLV